MITQEQVYGQLPLATKIARGYRVAGYETHDLAMEAVLHLLKRSNEANEAGSIVDNFRLWAASLLKRKIIDIRRNTLTLGKTREVGHEWLESVVAGNTRKPLDDAIDSENRSRLAEALEQLDETEKAIFDKFLGCFGDQDAQERQNIASAAEYGVSVVTFKRWRKTIMQKIRRFLSPL